MTGFRLDGGGETMVFRADGAPELLFWGPSLGPEVSAAALAPVAARAIPGGMLDGGEALSWLPEPGRGFTGHPALAAHRDGAELITQWTCVGVDRGPGRAQVALVDEASQVSLSLMLSLDAATGVLSSRVSLTNLGAPLTVDWLAAGALDCPHDELMLFDGRWAREFSPVRQRLVTGLAVKENRTGRTSHHAPPFVIAGVHGFGEMRGEVFGVHLAWSGDHRMLAERLRDGRIQIQAGELLHPGEMILGRGERYETPTLYIARSDHGLNGLSARFHPFVRDQILGGRLKGRPRPVNYNTWEAVYFDHDLATLKGLADLAASVGAERFVLDDGWFRGRPNDRSGLGDWTVDPAKYPDGLGPLIDHVRGLGLAFGLWVEPEMVNADSDLFRAHPDWILGVPGREQPLGRGQLVLDLTRAEVSEAIFGQLDALLRDNAISYLKWDMNRDLTHALSGGRAAVRRQTLAVYALLDRLRAAHPGVEIESCASGGARADFEILRRTDRVWTSDCNDPIERQLIQRGFSIFFPPEVMGAHVGPRASHTTARTASLRMRAYTALMGHMGMEADLRAFDEAERAQLAAVIALYKSHRSWMHAGRTLRLEHPDPGLIATALAGEGRMIVTAAQVATPLTAAPAPLRLTGLSPDARYIVRRLDPARGARLTPLLRGEPATAQGAVLEGPGLPLPILAAGQIAAFLIEAADGAEIAAAGDSVSGGPA